MLWADNVNTSHLDPNRMLRRATDFKIRMTGGGQMSVSINGQSCTGGAQTLALLDVFSQTLTMRQALDAMKPRIKGVQQWMDLTSEIIGLAEIGVLTEGEAEGQKGWKPAEGFSGSAIHHRMLRDRTRTERYIEAIRRTVRAGDVVVDIGTGTGVLAIAAAQAGASRVYAVEATRIGRLAESMFQANGLADRITLVEGMSTQIELPERADVLVSELIGDEPLSEQIQEVTRDAIARLLKPNARMVPEQIEVLALPLSMPLELFRRHVTSEETIREWREWYEIDFNSFLEFSRMDPRYIHLRSQAADSWLALADPVRLAGIDLRNLVQTTSESTQLGRFCAAGSLNSVMLCFRTLLAYGVDLSTLPGEVGDTNHWKSLVKLVDPARDVDAGEAFTMEYSYRKGRDPLRITVHD